MPEQTEERADYVIMNNTGVKAKQLVDFKMTQDMANRVSALLSLSFMYSLTNQENADWVNRGNKNPFPVRYKLPGKLKPKNKDYHKTSAILDKALTHLLNRK